MTIDEAPQVNAQAAIDHRLAAIGVLVHSAAAAATQLWCDASVDGDHTARLTEVSNALHRAALALSDVDLIGHGTTKRPAPALATELGETVIPRVFEVGLNMQSALELITDPAAAAPVQRAVEILDATINDIRTVVLEFNTGR